MWAPRVVPAVPNGGIGWVVVAAAFSVYLVAVGLQYVIGVYVRAWRASPEFAAASPSDLASVTSIESSCFLVGSLLVGYMVPRVGARVTSLLAAALLLVGSLVAALAPPTLATLCIFFGVVLGTGCAIAHVNAVVAVQQYFTSRRGIATGITVAGSGIGSFTLGPLLEYLVAHRGWGEALAIYGGIAASVCVVATAAFAPLVVKPPDPAPAEPSNAACRVDVVAGTDATTADCQPPSTAPTGESKGPVELELPAAAASSIAVVPSVGGARDGFESLAALDVDAALADASLPPEGAQLPRDAGVSDLVHADRVASVVLDAPAAAGAALQVPASEPAAYTPTAESAQLTPTPPPPLARPSDASILHTRFFWTYGSFMATFSLLWFTGELWGRVRTDGARMTSGTRSSTMFP